MSDGFLYQVAKTCSERLGEGISKYCFVFPNRRSSIFFRKYLGEMVSGPVFSPKLVTVDEFFGELSGLKQADRILSLYLLYQQYHKLSGTDESFDRFVTWGDVILNDFDDVDKYMADAEKLFANVRDLKELDSGYDFLSKEQLGAIRQFWGDFLKDYSSSEVNVTVGGTPKDRFIAIWKVLYPVYAGFREDLRAQGLGYSGMIYREVAEEAEKDGSYISRMIRSYGGVIFVGLNALNECELRLLDYVRDLRADGFDADFYWDFYGDMIKDPSNRSSLVMAKNVERYPTVHRLDDAALEPIAGGTEYHLIAVPSGVGQTGVASMLLSNLEHVDESTAVVLADEGMLDPMINAVPLNVHEVNVTMGESMGGSNVFSFMAAVQSLQDGKNFKEDGTCRFLYRDVASVVNQTAFPDSACVMAFRAAMVNDNVVFPERTWIMEQFAKEDNNAVAELVALIFKPITKAEEAEEYLHAILESLIDSLSATDKEFAYRYYTDVTRLSSLHIRMELKTYFRQLFALTSGESISFRGEPLKGLQIMGPLETRALDFENIIILSVNEGVLPASDNARSFIPYNIRKGYGLPNYELQDAVSAYNFYRAICRAKKVYMLYDSRTGGMVVGEPSRFVRQLKYHFGRKIEEHTVEYVDEVEDNQITTVPVPEQAPDFEEVAKTPEIMEKIDAKYCPTDEKGYWSAFSASNINTYLDCRMKFYYSSVEGLAAVEDVTEELDAAMFGTIFHAAAEDIYGGFGDLSKSPVKIDEAMLESVSDQTISDAVRKAFAEKCNIPAIEGKNLVVEKLLCRYLRLLLKSDAKMLEQKNISSFTMFATEQRVISKIRLDDGRTAKILGYVDRMDSFEPGVLRIADYKTGQPSVNNVKPEDVDAIFTREKDDKGRSGHSLQLLFYMLLMRLQPPEKRFGLASMRSCLLGLRTVAGFANGGGKTPESALDVEDTMLDSFEKRLKGVISEILDPAVPFNKTDVVDRCGQCDFRMLCNR
jgi:Inactivated superfamily I helicase